METVFWSRLQFAVTAAYHWLFVPLTLGLALVMAIMETLYVVKKDDFWKKAAWTKRPKTWPPPSKSLRASPCGPGS